jgi:hypothetical protein
LAHFDQERLWHERFDAENSATAMELLVQVCRKFNFTRPFELDGERRAFRPKFRQSQDPEHCSDCASHVDEPRAPAIEQAYRRGYVQGFAEAKRLYSNGKALNELAARLDELQRWRIAPLQIIGSSPGYDENLDLGLDDRMAISPKQRYIIFKRDGFRCQLCGAAQGDDIQLEVDHRKSVADGGDNSGGNLWTLCAMCNRGKGSDSL